MSDTNSIHRIFFTSILWKVDVVINMRKGHGGLDWERGDISTDLHAARTRIDCQPQEKLP